MLDVNLTGAFLVARHAVRALLAAQIGGSLVLTSSPAAFVGFAGGNNAAYAASKGGLTALVRTLALDYADRGIRVNTVVPGATDTPLLLAGVPAAQRDALRHELIARASEESRYVGWVTPRRSPRRSCGCGRMPPPTSPGRTSCATAV